MIKKIELTYIYTSEIIANSLTKLLIYRKFHIFIKQIHIT